MSIVFVIFLSLSLLFSIVNGNISELSASILQGAGDGITLGLQLAGPLCLWSGLAHCMEVCGWTGWLADRLSPVLRRLFPDAWRDRTAKEALCGNLAANLLGLGNAATPLGVRAVQRMCRGCDGSASDELCRLVVLNTASIQLIPATVAAVRAGLGAAEPFAILPMVWVTSVCSVTMGLLAAKGMALWI